MFGPLITQEPPGSKAGLAREKVVGGPLLAACVTLMYWACCSLLLGIREKEFRNASYAAQFVVQMVSRLWRWPAGWAGKRERTVLVMSEEFPQTISLPFEH